MYENSKKILFSLIILAVFIRIFSIAVLNLNRIQYSDEKVYIDIATSLVSGEGFSLKGKSVAVVTPIFPIFLSVIIFFTKNVLAIRFFNSLLIIPGIILIYLIGKRLFSKTVGLISALFLAFYPPFIYLSIVIYPQLLLSILIMAIIYLSIIIVSSRKLWQYFLFGVLGAIASLTVPVGIFFFAVFFIYVIIGQKRKIARVIILLSGFIIISSTWVVRNYIVKSSFIPFSTGGGMVLLMGNHPDATPSTYIQPYLEPWSKEFAQIWSLPEVERDKKLKKIGFSYIRERPFWGIPFLFMKFLNFWRPYPKPVTKSRFSGTIGKSIFAISWVPIFLFGVFGFIKHWRKKEIKYLFFSILVFGIIYAIFLTRTRYRMPLEPIFIILACSVFVELYEKIRKRFLRA